MSHSSVDGAWFDDYELWVKYMARGDLRSAWTIYSKAFLFVVLGSVSGASLLVEHGDWRFAALLAITVWAFCRAYYFAFYVIEHYVDDGYHFAGLIDFARYLAGRQRR